MKTINQFEPLVIEDIIEDATHLPMHGHNYYEIIYVLKGCGMHFLNSHKLPYKPGDLFILSPDDQHYFEIKKCTRFASIKFTDSYFSGHKNLAPDDFFMSRPENLMRHKLLKEVKLGLQEPCRTILRHTIEHLLAYNCRKDKSTSPIVYFQIMTILGMIKEDISKLDVNIGKGMPSREKLISYIHQHIYEPSKIQIKHIAAHFNIAPSYFSAYFKRNFDMSFREYINNYRMRLIESRIVSKHSTLKQIADEFGFTDESHLSNYFKKWNHASPMLFRKDHQWSN